MIMDAVRSVVRAMKSARTQDRSGVRRSDRRSAGNQATDNYRQCEGSKTDEHPPEDWRAANVWTATHAVTLLAAESGFHPLQTLGRFTHDAAMKQMTEAELLAQVQQHTTGNRTEIESSKYAECVSCLASYPAKEVEWKDEWTSPEKQNRVKRWSAQCPRCGKATVLGDSSGLLSQHYAVIVHDILARQKPKRR